MTSVDVSETAAGGSRLRPASRVACYALADLVSEPVLTLLAVVQMAVMLTPLVVLHAVKVGAIETMSAELAARPYGREVAIIGETELKEDALAALRAEPDVGFLVPETRFLAATHATRRLEPERGPRVDLDFRTTAPEDPIFGDGNRIPVGLTEIAVSSTAADALGASVGDVVQTSLRRMRRDAQVEVARLRLSVVAALPEKMWLEPTAFVSTALAQAMQGYVEFRIDAIDDQTVPVGDGQSWASMRIYANSVEAAPALRAALAKLGFEARVRVHAVEDLIAMKQVLDQVFLFLLVATAAGVGAALSAQQTINVMRKRRTLMLLALVGFRRGAVIAFPLVQAIVVSLCGAVAALGAAVLLKPWLDAVVAAYIRSETPIAALDAAPFVLGLAGVVAIATISCVGAIRIIAATDVAETLREL